MSSGQRPRWPEFFPAMKRRGKGRRRPARVILWECGTHGWRAPWPQDFEFEGKRYPVEGMSLTVTVDDGDPYRLNRFSGYWEAVG